MDAGDSWRWRSHAWARCLEGDRKSTRLNSSHQIISYAVFCLKKKIIESAIRKPRSKEFRDSLKDTLSPYEQDAHTCTRITQLLRPAPVTHIRRTQYADVPEAG